MQYLGGKSRLAKRFAHVLDDALLDARAGRFVEPFVGGFNVVPAILPTPALCADVHPGLVALYDGLQAGTFDPPHSLTEDEYRALREECDWSNPLTAFAAFACSFGGKEWGGYARSKRGSRNFAEIGRRSLLRKAEHMGEVEFACTDYREIELRPGDVVYADPPYLGTTEYKTGAFDHSAFYDWCERAAREVGAAVFVSEFTLPDRPGWEVAWQLDRTIAVEGKSSSGRRRVDYLARVT